ncbi:Crp/Fnr family transcriptional regulator [Tenacibaculum sp. 190524A02b]|uniref:Cyclic nucleotide-binding domain-containing protein n=1 Tax=Tenacibaculum vairaonense TaxID=3137860 RepID=A0ABM9PM93_9FLAO
MTEDIFRKVTEEYCEISPEAIFDWSEKIKIINYKKKYLLAKEGDHSTKFYYIIKGAVRAYYLLDDKKVSDWFAFENDFIPSTTQYLIGQKSNHYIELLEDSTLIELNQNDLEELCKKHHDFEHLYRLILSKIIYQLRERIASLQFRTVKQRYDSLIELHPTIELRVPLSDIASFLGTTPETLSRTRALR